MDINEIIKRFSKEKVILLPVEKLEDFLNSVEVVLEKDTLVNKEVRILKYNKTILFQELTNKDEIAIRKFNKVSLAKKLLEERMVVYENMWNGCGCKVDYYH